MRNDLLRLLPSIDELLATQELSALAEERGRNLVTDASRDVVMGVREAIVGGDESIDSLCISVRRISEQVVERIDEMFAPSMRYAVNAAGIILHTGLGRAMLSSDAVCAIHDAIRSHCTLAVNSETGQRQSRDVHVADLLCRLTGAEASTVANNNAAATMLILNSLAQGKEVIISRGQLVEIGGSFRMPDVMASSGAVMREVGTTNKTHLKDYASAISENTGAIMRVHHSNYRIIGFHEEPSIQELVELGHQHGIPVIDDIGSGALVDLSHYGLEPEPMVRESVSAGADVVCFSGDKLIGGPQCGIIVGKSEAIRRIKKNSLARALRVGKMTVAGLEATLKLFLVPERLNERHPVYRMMSQSLDELDARAQAMASGVREGLGDLADICVIDGGTQIGSGSVPGEMMPTRLVSVKPVEISADTLARRLRYGSPPIFARIHQDSALLDPRTIQPDEDAVVVKALADIMRS